MCEDFDESQKQVFDKMTRAGKFQCTMMYPPALGLIEAGLAKLSDEPKRYWAMTIVPTETASILDENSTRS